jgi:hypothetical protein
VWCWLCLDRVWDMMVHDGGYIGFGLWMMDMLKIMNSRLIKTRQRDE